MSRDARSSGVAGSGKIRVTFQAPRDAANYLQLLYDSRWPGLTELGIVAVQIGDDKAVACTAQESSVQIASSCNLSTSLTDCADSSLSTQHSVTNSTSRTRRRSKKRRKAEFVSDNLKYVGANEREVDDQLQNSSVNAREADAQLRDLSVTANSIQTVLHGVDQTSPTSVVNFKSNGQFRETESSKMSWPHRQNMQNSPTKALDNNAELYASTAYSLAAPNQPRLQSCSALNGVNYSHCGSTSMSRDCLVKHSLMSEVSPFLVNLLQNESFATATQGEIHRQISCVELPPPATSYVPKRRQSKKRRLNNGAVQLDLNRLSNGVANILPGFNDSSGVNSLKLKMPSQLAGKSNVSGSNADISQQPSCSTTSSYLQHEEKHNLDLLNDSSRWCGQVGDQVKLDEIRCNNVMDMKCNAYAAGYHRVPYSTSEINISTTMVPRFPSFPPHKANEEFINTTELAGSSARLSGVVRIPSDSAATDVGMPVSYSISTDLQTLRNNSHLSLCMPVSCPPVQGVSSFLNGDGSAVWSSTASHLGVKPLQSQTVGNRTPVSGVSVDSRTIAAYTSNETSVDISAVTNNSQSFCSSVSVGSDSTLHSNVSSNRDRMHAVVADSCMVPATGVHHPLNEMLLRDRSIQQIDYDHCIKSNNVSTTNNFVHSPTLHSNAAGTESSSAVIKVDVDTIMIVPPCETSVASVTDTGNQYRTAAVIEIEDHNYLKCVELNGIGHKNREKQTTVCDISGGAVGSGLEKLSNCRPLIDVSRDSSKHDDVSMSLHADSMRDDTKCRVVNGNLKTVETIGKKYSIVKYHYTVYCWVCVKEALYHVKTLNDCTDASI